jgi:ubiquinone/menaquinone biosynthesis C-methylase UbiE
MNKKTVKKHFDSIADSYDSYTAKRILHYNSTKEIIKKYYQKGYKVLEVGCGTGDVINFLNPDIGWGQDISPKMVELAKKKYGKNNKLKFSTNWPKEKFDYIFMTDVVEHLDDRRKVFTKIGKLLRKDGLFVNTMMNPVWEPLEIIYTKLGLKMPEGPHQRVGFDKLKHEAERSGLKIIEHDYKLLMPVYVPFITGFLNKYLEKYLKKVNFIEFFVAEKS